MNFATTSKQIEDAYTLARERYAAIGVDTEQSLATLGAVPISLHCWQGDDVLGFEDPDRGLSGGIMATGNYPGRARTVDELRSDLDVAYGVIPGSHRLNLHAMYRTRMKSHPAMRSNRVIFRAGQTGPERTITASTSTRHFSPIPWPTMVSPWPPTTTTSVSSGSSTASPAGRSALFSGGSWARRR